MLSVVSSPVLKASLPMVISSSDVEFDKVIVSKEEQPSKADSPMLVTLPGMVRDFCFKLLHPANAQSPMVVKCVSSAKEIDSKPIQLEKACLPIISTQAGMVTSDIFVQFIKAYSPIFVTPSSITTFLMLSL